MQLPELLSTIVSHLDQRNVKFQTHPSSIPQKLRAFQVSKRGTLRAVLENGTTLVIKGIRLARDAVVAPFALIDNLLTKFLPAEKQTRDLHTDRFVFPIFSLFSLFSLFGLFALIKLL